MAEWGSVHQLKGNVGVCHLWSCVVSLFQECILQESPPPRHLFLDTGTKVFSWFQDDKWACVNFAGEHDGGKISLQIIFSKEEQERGKEKFHLLSFYEKTAGEEFVFCLEFFRFLKEKELLPKNKLKVVKWEINRNTSNKVLEKLRDNKGLKILFFDRRSENLLQQVPDITQDLWFLAAEVYTCDEEGFESILDEKKEFDEFVKEFIPPKIQRQSKDFEAKKRELFWKIFNPEFQDFVGKPTIKCIYNANEKRLCPEDKDVEQIQPDLINTVFTLVKERFIKQNETEFKDFHLAYPEKDLVQICRQAESAVLPSMVRECCAQASDECSSQESVPSQPQETEKKASLLSSDEMEEIEALRKEIQSLEKQNNKLEAEKRRLGEENENLRKEKGNLEKTNRSLEQKQADLQNRLDKKESVRAEQQNKERNGHVQLTIPCSEERLFPDEIEDFLYDLLYSAIEQVSNNLPVNEKKEVSRKRDVIEAILEEKTFGRGKLGSSKKQKNIDQVSRDSPVPSEKDLVQICRQAGSAVLPLMVRECCAQASDECSSQESIPSQPQETEKKASLLSSDKMEEIEALRKEIQSLEEQNDKLKAEKRRLGEENEKLRDENESLEKTNRSLEQKQNNLQEQLNRKMDTLTQRQNEERQGIVQLTIPCSEERLFPDEIEDYLYALLYFTIEQEKKRLLEDKKKEVARKRDVIEAILSNKTFDWDKSGSSKKQKNIEQVFQDSPVPSEKDLKGTGLHILDEKKGVHPHLYFYNKRYKVPYAGTPGDKGKGRTADNKITEINKWFFLIPPKRNC